VDLIAGQVMTNVLDVLVQLLGLSKDPFAVAMQVLTLDADSLRCTDHLHSEHCCSGRRM
jgi:hypothetical protein